MKRVPYVALFVFLAGAAFAQKAPIKFGDIPMEDIRMTVYPKDSSADAVVLADYGTTEIKFNEATNHWEIIFERLYRLKILTNEGLKYANVKMLHLPSTEGEEGLKIVTYNLINGKIVETKSESPVAKVGSVIEIFYRKTTKSVFALPEWEFQSVIPVRFSEYRTVLPEYFGYARDIQGYVVLTLDETSTKTGGYKYSPSANSKVGPQAFLLNNVSQAYTAKVSRMVANDVPAFKPEPFITNADDYISKVRYDLAYIRYLYPTLDVINGTNDPVDGATTQLSGNNLSSHRPVYSVHGSNDIAKEGYTPVMGTWDQLAKMYWDRIEGKIMDEDKSLRLELEKAIAGATTDEQKVTQIFDYVRKAVSWNDVSDKVPTQSPGNVLDTKKGSAADINILLTSMITKTGIPAFPVLLSTRDHGAIREGTPVASQFNYLLCAAKAGGKLILLDATAPALPVGAVPDKCLNGAGFMVTPAGFEWVTLTSPMKTRNSYSVDMLVTTDGVIDATLGGSHLTEHATLAGDSISFSPFVAGRKVKNPFEAAERLYPVDFGKTFEEFYIAKIQIPNGYVISKMPENKIASLAGNAGRYAYSITQSGNTLNFTSLLSINRQRFTQHDYANLREFYNIIVSKQTEQIVLIKK